MEEKRCCKNCKYYIAHYIKEKMRFKSISGHCVNTKKSGRHMYKIIMGSNLCEYWEQKEIFDTSKSIRETIFEISDQLTKILEVLENED